MKKSLMTITMLATGALLFNAFAFTIEDRGPDGNYGNMPHHGIHSNYYTEAADNTSTREARRSPDVVIHSEAEAKSAIESHVIANLKGYTVGTVKTVQHPRGMNVYFISATDASSNEFTFIVDQFGRIRGPIAGNLDPEQHPRMR